MSNYHGDRSLSRFLSTAPRTFIDGESIRKFQLQNGDFIHCVLWQCHFYITGTDIVKILSWRFQSAGRVLNNVKKFEEGIFSDLRNLKPGIDATLEGPRSEFLEFLYKNGCIRTQKKQKVFFWYSVPHDTLFGDVLERDSRRETNVYAYLKYLEDLSHDQEFLSSFRSAAQIDNEALLRTVQKPDFLSEGEHLDLINRILKESQFIEERNEGNFNSQSYFYQILDSLKKFITSHYIYKKERHASSHFSRIFGEHSVRFRKFDGIEMKSRTHRLSSLRGTGKKRQSLGSQLSHIDNVRNSKNSALYDFELMKVPEKPLSSLETFIQPGLTNHMPFPDPLELSRDNNSYREANSFLNRSVITPEPERIDLDYTTQSWEENIFTPSSIPKKSDSFMVQDFFDHKFKKTPEMPKDILFQPTSISMPELDTEKKQNIPQK